MKLNFVTCEWCPDNTCEAYWEVQVFDKLHRICNCCYTRLKKMEGSPREN